MARSYFEQQQRARGRTGLLVLLLILATELTILALYLVFKVIVALVLVVTTTSAKGSPEGFEVVLGRELLFWYQDPTLPLVAIVTGSIVIGGALLKILQLRPGGSAVAELMRARAVEPSTQEPGERLLCDVTEELALASGCPVPRLFVLDTEPAVNVLVAGRTTRDAVVIASRGSLARLGRRELRAVLAHELSEIFNGEMRLNLRVACVLAGLVAVGKLGGGGLRALRIERANPRSGKETAGDAAFFAVAVVLSALGGFGVIAGRLVKSLLSGRSAIAEDGWAARLTRDRSGLASALTRVREGGSRIINMQVEDLSQMFFACANGTLLLPVFSSHPTLQHRLAALGQGDKEPEEQDDADIEPERHLAILKSAETAGLLATPTAAALSIGRPAYGHLVHARTVLGAIPAPMRAALRTPDGARAVVYAFFLVAGATEQKRITGDAPALELARGFAPRILELGAYARLALLELCLPVLRRMAPDELQRFLEAVEDLVASGGRAGVFDNALAAIVAHRLRGPARAADATALARVPVECARLLSLLVHSRQATIPAIPPGPAYEAAMKALFPAFPPPPLFNPGECTPKLVAAALARLTSLSAQGKERLVHAMAETVLAAGRVTIAEAELLRGLITALDCPMPPLLDGAAVV